jgi:hypothetical protein
VANREIARRLGVTPKAIRKLLKRMGWHDPAPAQILLPIAPPDGDPNLSAFWSAPAIEAPGEASVPGGPNLSAFISREEGPIPVSFDRTPRTVGQIGFSPTWGCSTMRRPCSDPNFVCLMAAFCSRCLPS